MGGRANRRRGEIEAIIDGERRILCLTLPEPIVSLTRRSHPYMG